MDAGHTTPRRVDIFASSPRAAMTASALAMMKAVRAGRVRQPPEGAE